MVGEPSARLRVLARLVELSATPLDPFAQGYLEATLVASDALSTARLQVALSRLERHLAAVADLSGLRPRDRVTLCGPNLPTCDGQVSLVGPERLVVALPFGRIVEAHSVTGAVEGVRGWTVRRCL